uniref:Ig-like domain-containing protein n=1 Tax=Cyprinodon variegatus TaxID=28743 RepID=A0A3Q2GEK7_CYPVA
MCCEFGSLNVKYMIILTDVRCEQLTQPASMTVQPGQSLTISCQVSYSVSSYQTHWIRQPAGKALEWIGYMCEGCSGNRKDSLKNKFSITVHASSKTVTLNGNNMQPQDTAVYYCSEDVVQNTRGGALTPLIYSRFRSIHFFVVPLGTATNCCSLHTKINYFSR